MSRAAAAILQPCDTRLTLRMVGRDMERPWVLDDLTKPPNHPEAPYAQDSFYFYLFIFKLIVVMVTL